MPKSGRCRETSFFSVPRTSGGGVWLDVPGGPRAGLSPPPTTLVRCSPSWSRRRWPFGPERCAPGGARGQGGRGADDPAGLPLDWANFTLWCDGIGASRLPAAPGVVAAYVAELADPPDDRAPATVSTITRRLAAVGEGHKATGRVNPRTDELVRATVGGVRRMRGVTPARRSRTS